MNIEKEPVLIGLDWGTTSLRCYLMADDGTVLNEKSSDDGIMTVEPGRYEAVLGKSLEAWLGDHRRYPIVASGMVTSPQGWIEIPHLECPSGAGALAAALHRHDLANGIRVHFITGLRMTGSDGVPDVMRGEETQIVGALTDGDEDRLFVLPGTHSKWALTTDGGIAWFATFMTGEVYSVLRRHSILGRLIDTDEDNVEWFDRGVDYGLSTDPIAGGLLKKLFGTRALRLFDEVPASGAASHLSGLLIGTEIRDATYCVADRVPIEKVTILGESGLVALYVRAIARSGLAAIQGPNAAAARGHHVIARAAGLIESDE